MSNEKKIATEAAGAQAAAQEESDGSDSADALAAGIMPESQGMSPMGRELFHLAADIQRMQSGIDHE